MKAFEHGPGRGLGLPKSCASGFKCQCPAPRPPKPSPFAATSKAEASKHAKYDGPVATMNPPLKFVAIAFNDFGGIGFEFY